MSQQYQKQKKKWFELGKQQTLKDELKFLKEFKRGQQKWLTYQLIKLIDRINKIEQELLKEVQRELK
jgi:hypothetical protein